MIREPYNLNPYNSTIDTSKVNNFSFTFSGDELGSWNIEIAKNNTSPEIVYTSEEFVPEDVGYTHIYDGDIVEGITLPSTIAHSQGDDGLLRRLYSINGYPFNAAVVKLNVNGIENIGNIKGSTANGYLVATNYSLGRTGSNVTIVGFDKDGTIIGSQVADGTYDFLGYLLSVKENSNIEVGQVVQIGGNSFVIGSIEDAGDGYSELTIVNGEATSSDVTPILTFDSLAEADVTELTVGIEPVQDLNGFDKPWVGGAGKNILDVADRTISGQPQTPETIRAEGCTVTKSGGTLTCTITGAWSKLWLAIDTSTLVNGQTYTVSAKFSNPSANVVGVGWYDTTWHNTTTSRDTTATVSTSFTYSSDMSTVALGFIVNNTSASTGNTVVVSEMQLEKGSSKTSYAPYSNICPITGHDEVRVTRTGKNLCSQTGVNNAVIGQAKQGKTYTFSVRNQGGCGYNIKKNSNSGAKIASTEGEHPTDAVISLTFTVDEDCNLFLNGYGMNGYTFLQSAYDYQLELGSTATDYEPYQGSTYTTSLGQTVYGGTLDMVTGQLVVDRGIVDMGSLTWLLNSSLNGKPAFFVRLNDAKTVSASSVADMTTSCYSVISAYNLYLQKDNTGIIALNDQNYLQVRDTRYSTASDYKSGITGQQLVYELATPLTYTLTPQQIKTLVGTNNVWASSGDIVSIKFTYETN